MVEAKSKESHSNWAIIQELTSRAVLALFNAVKALGRADSSTRAADTASSSGKLPFVEKFMRVSPKTLGSDGAIFGLMRLAHVHWDIVAGRGGECMGIRLIRLLAARKAGYSVLLGRHCTCCKCSKVLVSEEMTLLSTFKRAFFAKAALGGKRKSLRLLPPNHSLPLPKGVIASRVTFKALSLIQSHPSS